MINVIVEPIRITPVFLVRCNEVITPTKKKNFQWTIPMIVCVYAKVGWAEARAIGQELELHVSARVGWV